MIPQNPYNPSNDIDKYSNMLEEDLARNNNQFGAIETIDIAPEILKEVLALFKDKGWYCYYLQRFDGVWLDIRVYSKPQTFTNQCLNKVLKF